MGAELVYAFHNHDYYHLVVRYRIIVSELNKSTPKIPWVHESSSVALNQINFLFLFFFNHAPDRFCEWRLKVRQAVPNDTGNYTCVSTIAQAASVFAHVISGK